MTVAYCVDPQMVGRVWPRVDNYIRQAIIQGGVGTDFNEVVDDLVNERALLWIGFDRDANLIVSAGVTQLTTDKVCTLVAYGGRREDHLLQTIEDYARAEGCTRMRVLGRKGWIRVLKNYHQPYVVLEKELT